MKPWLMNKGTTGIAFLKIAGIPLILVGSIAIYTYVENYLDDSHAKKNKVAFKAKNSQTKGYWKTKDGEEYDEGLKLED